MNPSPARLGVPEAAGGQRQEVADFGYCHGHVLKAVRAVDLCQTLVECTEREMTGLAGYL